MSTTLTLIEAAKLTEEEARDYLEAIRWPEGPVCPHCGCFERIYKLEGESHRPGLYKCGDCRQQFTVTVGTIMHRSKIPLHKWVLAFHLLCSSKKGISALQLQRNLDLGSYRTAWHMAHRIRLAMAEEPLASMLQGTVEVDETYIGGKSRQGIRGRGSERKTPVLALVERNGKMRSRPVERVTAEELKGAIRDTVHPSARIVTDDLASYKGLGDEYEGGHGIVRHSAGEYVQGDAHTNTAESYFALLKRGVHGAFHDVSKHHLHRYCDEFEFRLRIPVKPSTRSGRSRPPVPGHGVHLGAGAERRWSSDQAALSGSVFPSLVES